MTVGAAGSHHVLATAIYARDVDIDVEAVLVPQPRTPHVVENLRATSARARVFPATSVAHAATLIVDRVACGAHYVPMGGSTREGVAAYADAAAELLEQVARGELPEPRVVVVALGSGGTAAGLTAGFARARSPVRVIGVTVTEPRRWVGQRARRMVRACLRDVAPRGAVGALEVNPRYLGAGYGHPTEEGARAVALGARYGLTLDDTYTGKAFAALQDLTANDDPVVFWDTLSSAPLAPFLEGAPSEEDLCWRYEPSCCRTVKWRQTRTGHSHHSHTQTAGETGRDSSPKCDGAFVHSGALRLATPLLTRARSTVASGPRARHSDGFVTRG